MGFILECLGKAIGGQKIPWGEFLYKAIISEIEKIRKGTTPHTCIGPILTLLIYNQIGGWSVADNNEMD